MERGQAPTEEEMEYEVLLGKLKTEIADMTIAFGLAKERADSAERQRNALAEAMLKCGRMADEMGSVSASTVGLLRTRERLRASIEETARAALAELES